MKKFAELLRKSNWIRPTTSFPEFQQLLTVDNSIKEATGRRSLLRLSKRLSFDDLRHVFREHKSTLVAGHKEIERLRRHSLLKLYVEQSRRF